MNRIHGEKTGGETPAKPHHRVGKASRVQNSPERGTGPIRYHQQHRQPWPHSQKSQELGNQLHRRTEKIANPRSQALGKEIYPCTADLRVHRQKSQIRKHGGKISPVDGPLIRAETKPGISISLPKPDMIPGRPDRDHGESRHSLHTLDQENLPLKLRHSRTNLKCGQQPANLSANK